MVHVISELCLVFVKKASVERMTIRPVSNAQMMCEVLARSCHLLRHQTRTVNIQNTIQCIIQWSF